MAHTERQGKPTKPYPDFPLYAHATGRWAKRIRGTIRYFGPWNDWQAALAKYQEQKDDLYAGRTPRVASDSATLGELCNLFMASKEKAVESGELARVTWLGYDQSIKRMLAHINRDAVASRLTPDDFRNLRSALAAERGPTSLANDITRLRVLFKYARDRKLAEVDLGPDFKKPSKRVLRQATTTERMFTHRQLLRLIYRASPQMRAMILLGINCAFGNEDCAVITAADLDLDGRWHTMARTKNANPRRCYLWAATVAAIRAATNDREDGPLFVTTHGGKWAKPNDRPLSKEFAKLCKAVGIYRRGINFYSLRRSFRTVADRTLDSSAVGFIMGHIDESMGGTYRQVIADDRLIAVSSCVADWLFRRNNSIDLVWPSVDS